jgi:hypothetical protein
MHSTHILSCLEFGLTDDDSKTSSNPSPFNQCQNRRRVPSLAYWTTDYWNPPAAASHTYTTRRHRRSEMERLKEDLGKAIPPSALTKASGCSVRVSMRGMTDVVVCGWPSNRRTDQPQQPINSTNPIPPRHTHALHAH